jgi:hypothetical protein
MTSKKPYIRPVITKIYLDKSFILMQVSNPEPFDTPPPPTGGKGITKKGYAEPPLKSPFGDKPFG